MNRTERLLDLITYLLNAQEPVSWQEIKNHFPDDYARGVEESNQRKFERDKAELISLGIPIDYQSGSELRKEGYIIEEEKLFLPEIKFSPEELSLLTLAAGAVTETDGFPYRDQLESALFKIVSLHNPIEPPPRELRITYSKQDQRPVPWIDQIQDALQRKKWVKFTYHAFTTGQTKERKVNPYGLVFRRGNWSLIGWDHLRRGMRTFVLTRIRELQVNRKRPGTSDYEIPPDFTLRDYRDQQTWEFQMHEPFDVDIQVSEHRLPELRSQLRRAEPLPSDVFRIRVTNREGFLFWVLAQRTDVRVLEPPEIQQEIHQAVQGLL